MTTETDLDAPFAPDWVLVPRVPTDAMLRAAQSAWLNDPQRRTTTMWSAMLAAAPSPATQQATQAVPQGWPRATKGQRDQGWTLEYRFLERVTDLAAPRTEYSTSMEATEQVLIAALEVLATQHQEPTT